MSYANVRAAARGLGGTTTVALISASDPDPLAKLASQFQVENVPAGDTDYLTDYLVLQADSILPAGLIAAAAAHFPGLTDSQVLAAAANTESDIRSTSSEWYQAAAAGYQYLQWPFGQAGGTNLYIFLQYAYEVAKAGLPMHVPEVAAAAVSQGKLTREALRRDQLLRRGIFQGIDKIFSYEPFKTQLLGKPQVDSWIGSGMQKWVDAAEAQAKASSGLGFLAALPVAAWVAITVVAVAVVIILAYTVMALVETRNKNALLAQLIADCRKEWSSTGKESPLCTTVRTQVMPDVLKKDPSDLLGLKPYLKYAPYVVGGAVLLYFAPFILRKVGELRAARGPA